MGARRLSTQQEHKHSLRGVEGKVGVAGPTMARTCNPKHTEASIWFFTSAALCAKTWVLPMVLSGSWCYHDPLACPWWYQPGPKPHANPPNLGSQTLRLQMGFNNFVLVPAGDNIKLDKGSIALSLQVALPLLTGHVTWDAAYTIGVIQVGAGNKAEAGTFVLVVSPVLASNLQRVISHCKNICISFLFKYDQLPSTVTIIEHPVWQEQPPFALLGIVA